MWLLVAAAKLVDPVPNESSLELNMRTVKSASADCGWSKVDVLAKGVFECGSRMVKGGCLKLDVKAMDKCRRQNAEVHVEPYSKSYIFGTN